MNELAEKNRQGAIAPSERALLERDCSASATSSTWSMPKLAALWLHPLPEPAEAMNEALKRLVWDRAENTCEYWSSRNAQREPDQACGRPNGASAQRPIWRRRSSGARRRASRVLRGLSSPSCRVSASIRRRRLDTNTLTALDVTGRCPKRPIRPVKSTGLTMAVKPAFLAIPGDPRPVPTRSRGIMFLPQGCLRMRRQTSWPFNFGKPMSSSTTSGRKKTCRDFDGHHAVMG